MQQRVLLLFVLSCCQSVLCAMMSEGPAIDDVEFVETSIAVKMTRPEGVKSNSIWCIAPDASDGQWHEQSSIPPPTEISTKGREQTFDILGRVEYILTLKDLQQDLDKSACKYPSKMYCTVDEQSYAYDLPSRSECEKRSDSVEPTKIEVPTRGQLELVGSPFKTDVGDGTLKLDFALRVSWNAKLDFVNIYCTSVNVSRVHNDAETRLNDVVMSEHVVHAEETISGSLVNFSVTVGHPDIQHVYCVAIFSPAEYKLVKVAAGYDFLQSSGGSGALQINYILILLIVGLVVFTIRMLCDLLSRKMVTLTPSSLYRSCNLGGAYTAMNYQPPRFARYEVEFSELCTNSTVFGARGLQEDGMEILDRERSLRV